MENLKKTHLHNTYKQYGGKLVEFGGWEMPIQFEGIISEHEAVRRDAGLFDVSHMGEVDIKGSEAFEFVQNLVTNDIAVLKNNQILYTFMCYSNGGVVDDLLVYKYSEEHYYLVINAGNIEKDVKWMIDNKGAYNVEIINNSDEVSEIAIQGPKAQKILQKITDLDLNEIKFFYFKRDVLVDGVKCLISRTGYTGEDGFEIYTSNGQIEKLWHKLLNIGEEDGLKPTGLGCRDTLRFEAALPLYGNELSQDITPLEAGLGYFVKLQKLNFIGKEALLKQKEEGLKRKSVGFEMKERGIPRHGYEVTSQGEKNGVVTTGYLSPTLKKNIGLALIDAKYSELGTEIEIVIRNKPVKAEVISKKFYKKNYNK
ncbi:glycine cleavage system aminomethyltransferase GcvT [Clostridium sp.]|uniref:glycine cleavage system aminomethyltransferase GcvT n=1 Tax=Clostridium sp. TaxID=1506 RepID=UPI001A41C6F8|nr:glycine cleavage system aminomethyltransferase GcvT [Clostridium sp.]MBK5240447.1 glycine cleavage system aminomethyltransferase GcvT [Clostridium sp.]